MYKLAKSLRTLTEELTGIRLAAADTSLWSIQSSVAERARLAINDAINTHKFYYEAVDQTIRLPYKALKVAIPPWAERVIEVGMWDSSMVVLTSVTDFDHIPTPQTNLIKVDVTPASTNSARYLEVHYEARVQELPPPMSLKTNVGSADATFVVPVNAYKAKGNWPPEGYFELSAMQTSREGYREVVHYQSISATTGFLCDVRGAMDTTPLAWAASDSVYISPLLVAPPEAIASLMVEAEANMFAYWVGHRAQYDQYVVAAGQEALDVETILAVVRTLEGRAERRYSKVRRVPRVTQITTRRKDGTGT